MSSDPPARLTAPVATNARMPPVEPSHVGAVTVPAVCETVVYWGMTTACARLAPALLYALASGDARVSVEPDTDTTEATSHAPTPAPCDWCRNTSWLAAKPAGAVTVTVIAPAAPVAGERTVLIVTVVVKVAAPSWPEPVTGLMHVPETHICPEAQVRPHTPQWEVLVWRLTSQPSAAVTLQSPKPDAQEIPHAPAAQVAVALEPTTGTRCRSGRSGRCWWRG